MKQQCSLRCEQMQAMAFDTLQCSGQPEYEVALKQPKALGFAGVAPNAVSGQPTRPRQDCVLAKG